MEHRDRCVGVGRRDVHAARIAAARCRARGRRASGDGARRRPGAGGRRAARRRAQPSARRAGISCRVARRQRALAGLARHADARGRRPHPALHRRQLGRDRAHDGRGRAPGQRDRKTQERGEVGVPRPHEPRVAHAAECRARLRPVAAARPRPRRARATRAHRPRSHCRRPPAVADQQCAGLVEPGIGRAAHRTDAGAGGRRGGRGAAHAGAAGPTARHRGSRRSAGRLGARRSHAPEADRDQPAQQRHQVQPRAG